MGDPLSRGPVAWPVLDVNDRPSPVPMYVVWVMIAALGLTLAMYWIDEHWGAAHLHPLTFKRMVLGAIVSCSGTLLVWAALRNTTDGWLVPAVILSGFLGRDMLRGGSAGSLLFVAVAWTVFLVLLRRWDGDHAKTKPQKPAPWDELA